MRQRMIPLGAMALVAGWALLLGSTPAQAQRPAAEGDIRGTWVSEYDLGDGTMLTVSEIMPDGRYRIWSKFPGVQPILLDAGSWSYSGGTLSSVSRMSGAKHEFHIEWLDGNTFTSVTLSPLPERGMQATFHRSR